MSKRVLSYLLNGKSYGDLKTHSMGGASGNINLRFPGKTFFRFLTQKWHQSTHLDELSIFVKKGFFVPLEIKKLSPFDNPIFPPLKGRSIFSHSRREEEERKEGREGEQTLK